MFRSSTIIRELALNLAKVIFLLKNPVKLRRYLLCDCVAACHVLHAQHATQTPYVALGIQHAKRMRHIYRYL